MDAHLNHPTDCKFFPLPGQIKGHIDAMVSDDGRLGAEEAWALVLAAQDERDSVVWTPEIAEAWGVARHVMPDEVGARMAFKEAYTRLLRQVRAERRPLQWVLSEGADREGRIAALRDAHAKDRVVEGAEHLLALANPKSVTALLQGPADREHGGLSAAGLAAIQRMRRSLAVRGRPQDGAGIADRRRTDELRAAAEDRVQAYVAEAARDPIDRASTSGNSK
jgi:hypothetical protein